MNQDAEATPRSHRRRQPFPGAVLVGLLVVLLALAALLVPRAVWPPDQRLVLVLDPLARARGESTYGPLVQWMGSASNRSLRLVVVRTLKELRGQNWKAVDLVLCPDGVALGLPAGQYVGLVAGRRRPPDSRRSPSVLVYRRRDGVPLEPWYTDPEHTILGDSLSLAGFGPICTRGLPLSGDTQSQHWRRQWTFGPDPYDHAPVLHALRLGCFDYAVVRKVAVERFLSAGLLDPRQWGIRELTGPLPDVVIMVTRRWPVTAQTGLGNALAALGRNRERAGRGEEAVLSGLELIDLDGFNILPETDFEAIKRQFDRCWPDGGI
jgi:hypothetical protein